MSLLTVRDQELVALGAAMGSNCVSCIEHHVPVARDAGLNDAQISEAIRLANKLRQVPARQTLDAARNLLATSAPAAETAEGCCG
jgi:AhpD family alkylhydroperoxidase